jgi:hypothetical protein
MTEVGNSNLKMVRLDPNRLQLFGKLRRKREKEGEVLRRAIDALAEKEGVDLWPQPNRSPAASANSRIAPDLVWDATGNSRARKRLVRIWKRQ